MSIILKGITIHLFLTNTLQEELELNEYDLDIFDNEIDNKLLFIYENQEQIIDNNEVIAVDGTKISCAVLQEIRIELRIERIRF